MNLPAELAQAVQQGRIKTLDLAYALDEHSPFWPEGSPVPPFRASTAATDEHDGFFARHLQWSERSGTHMDASRHLDPQSRGVDEIPARDFLLAAAAADVRATVSACADDRLAAKDWQKCEQTPGAWARQDAARELIGWGL